MSSLVDTRSVISSWKTCVVCRSGAGFKTPREFAQHLRDFHCSKEGGSFVCRYGMNGVCPSLPLEGVSDRDYDDHVSRDHVYCDTGMTCLRFHRTSSLISSHHIIIHILI